MCHLRCVRKRTRVCVYACVCGKAGFQFESLGKTASVYVSVSHFHHLSFGCTGCVPNRATVANRKHIEMIDFFFFALFMPTTLFPFETNTSRNALIIIVICTTKPMIKINVSLGIVKNSNDDLLSAPVSGRHVCRVRQWVIRI